MRRRPGSVLLKPPHELSHNPPPRPRPCCTDFAYLSSSRVTPNFLFASQFLSVVATAASAPFLRAATYRRPRPSLTHHHHHHAHATRAHGSSRCRLASQTAGSPFRSSIEPSVDPHNVVAVSDRNHRPTFFFLSHLAVAPLSNPQLEP